jgi:hypothetical protein
MADGSERGNGGGFTLLDGAALVTGAAVAAVHLRGAAGFGLARGVWGLFWITFAGIALTAAGSFLFLARRFGRRPPGYPRLGDRLWGLLGLPWVGASLLRTSAPSGATRAPDLYAAGLAVGIAVTSFVALAVLWQTWVLKPPAARAPVAEPGPWTDRVGLALAVAWPLQCGFALVVIG